MKRKLLRAIITPLWGLFLIFTFVSPVLAYDGMGGMYSEFTLGSSGTANSYLAINTATLGQTALDIRSSTGISSGINQATQVARDVLPLMAIVSILVIMGGVVARLGGGSVMELVGVQSPVFVVVMLAVVVLVAVVFLSPLQTIVNSLP